MFSVVLPRAHGAWLAAPIAGLIAFGAHAAEPKSELANLLAIARQLNPDIAAAALDADAARARVDYAGAWDDPKVKIELTSPRDDFGSLSEEAYQIRQMLPLWGQTGLKREIAEWEASKATASVHVEPRHRFGGDAAHRRADDRRHGLLHRPHAPRHSSDLGAGQGSRPQSGRVIGRYGGHPPS